MSSSHDPTPMSKKRAELVLLVASLSLLGATVVWFFFWADPDQHGRWSEAGQSTAGIPASSQPTAGQPLESAPLSSGDSATTAATPAELPITSSTRVKSPHFEVGQKCALCHAESKSAQAMRDAAGQSVAPYDLWQTSMMAQSARDPYWRAVLSAEVAATPNQKAHIEEVCTRCHAPMATPVETSPPGQVMAFLQSDAPRAELGLDGVSCTVCHQMTDEGFGTDDSFTGKFKLNTDSLIYGPHAQPVTMPMQRHVEYTPTHGPHVMQSALCATCHTVITEAVTPDGTPTAQAFHEQTPYLEWRNSDFNDERESPASTARSCQSCHMPTTDDAGQPIATTLAHNPGGRDFPFLEHRQPYGRHTLVGGNAFMTRLLRDNAEALGISAPKSAFDASITAVQKMLREQTARVTIGNTTRQDQRLQIPVSIQNLCGHKFPTAYPSRRAWLQVSVYATDDALIFASGRFNSQGQLLDAKGQVSASELADGSIQPHMDRIQSGDQVQIYETVMGNTAGQPTFYLLHGAEFLKDNRLLPQGWQAEHPDGPATQPAGTKSDNNFQAGTDRVLYEVPVLGEGPYRIEVALYFQSISPRHAAELFTNETPEVATFQSMYNAADHQPELIDKQIHVFKD